MSKPLQIKTTDSSIYFILKDKIVGEYALNDNFKPHFRQLKTAQGYEILKVGPGDHRHHKGLMYALRCKDLNFWEESETNSGVQRIIKTVALENGFQQELLWLSSNGDLETYREYREITCQYDEASEKLEYTWSTKREALRDHTLIKSEYSMEIPDGRKINYHGLGVRLPWIWVFPNEQFSGIQSQGKSIKNYLDVSGSNGPEMSMWGKIDGQWHDTFAKIEIQQHQDFTWYVYKNLFPYLACGPSNAHDLDVKQGETFEESYVVSVSKYEPKQA